MPGDYLDRVREKGNSSPALFHDVHSLQNASLFSRIESVLMPRLEKIAIVASSLMLGSYYVLLKKIWPLLRWVSGNRVRN